jgi:hypothetical protein
MDSTNTKDTAKSETLKNRMDDVYKKLKSANVWTDERKRKKAEKLLTQLEQLAENQET